MILLNKILPINVKNWLKLKLLRYKYKSGYFNSIVPTHFLKTIGNQIGENIIFTNWNIEIGDYCFIGDNTEIDNCLKIDSFSCISKGVKIGVGNHALDHISINPLFYDKYKGWINKKTFHRGRPVIIGADVLISANVIILEGVKIGIGAVVAAGAVVVKDVPPYAIVGGIPAKVIKYRFEKEVIDNLIESEWWKMSKEELLKYSDFFDNPLEFLKMINI